MRVDEETIVDDDAIFDKSFASNQQADLINAINNLLSAYRQNDNSELAAAVNKLSQSHETFLRKISELQSPTINIPETKININNNELAQEIKAMTKSINELKQSVLSTTKEWEFIPQRNSNDFIISIKAIAK